MCDGLWAELDAPSPKSHAQLVGPPVDVSVNCTESAAAPGANVKFGVGATGVAGANDSPRRCRSA